MRFREWWELVCRLGILSLEKKLRALENRKAKVPILWPPDMKSLLIGKDPDVGKQEEKGATEDEMVGWHH